ncbi:MAG: peptidoglycan-binding protein [Deltaproteobacteria bacterium]|nr:MAG: peptidoglycan-binding protein [Deltaproteobacteria bacterium]
MGFRDYSESFKTPLPAFSRTEVSLDKLIAAWEKLRELDIAGYRTSQGNGNSAFLVKIACADGTLGPSAGNGVSCSPFTGTALMMALSDGGPPYQPKLSDGSVLTKLFNSCVNGNLSASHKGVKQYGLNPKRDNGWVRACIAFNLAEAIHPGEMRRGDAVGIDWDPKGGHAVYCWDVHTDRDGKVDAFLYISSNGKINTDPLGGAGFGVSIGGCTQHLKKVKDDAKTGQPRYEVLKTPCFEDEEDNVRRGAWVTWLGEAEAKKIDLQDGRCRVPPKQKYPSARIKAIEVARFHGMNRPEPYAMGAAAGKPPVHIPEVETTEIPAGEEATPEKVKAKAKPVEQKKEEPTLSQLMVEQRLKALYVLGIIDKDNGEPDAVNDSQSQEAVKAFQQKYGLKVDGIAGPKTKAKMREVWVEVSRSPEGQHYLATGEKSAPPGEAAKFLLGFFWRHGSAKPGEKVKLHVVATGYDGQSFPIKVKDSVSGKTADPGVILKIDDGSGVAEVAIPDTGWGFGSSASIFATADGLGQSFAPLYLRA